MPRSERRPWSSFYWGDWLADPAVRMLGNERRGRYIDFLALSNQSESPGRHSEDEVREMLGYTSEEWDSQRPYFVRCFRVRGTSWVQQRTVEEFDRSERQRATLSNSGRKGVAVRESNRNKITSPASSPAYASAQSQAQSMIEAPEPDSGGESLFGDRNTLARPAVARECANGKPPEAEPKGFRPFYDAYPRHEKPRRAAKEFERALKRHPDLSAEDLAWAAGKFAAQVKREGTEKRFVIYPEGWLSSDGFLEFFEEGTDGEETEG